MLDSGLRKICEFVGAWCEDTNVRYSVVCDESDIQCIFLFSEDKPKLNELYDMLNPILDSNNICMKNEKIRGGTILAFSIRALSEQVFSKMLRAIDEFGKTDMNLKDKLDYTFSQVINIQESKKKKQTQKPQLSLAKSAKKIAESIENKTKQKEEPKQALGKPKFMTLDDLRSIHVPKKHDNFNTQLQEALDGMATPNNTQPNDLFAKFGNALRVFGEKLGIGSVQDMLAQRGIKYNKSKDGQAVILYVINGSTKTPQPIARINSSLLEKPADFENQLLNVLDFAKGEAPGTTKQRQEELKNQQTVARDIAQQMQPQEQELSLQQTQPAQAQQQAQQQAPVAAATQAASLKQQQI